jgi:hypothetical protein
VEENRFIQHILHNIEQIFPEEEIVLYDNSDVVDIVIRAVIDKSNKHLDLNKKY